MENSVIKEICNACWLNQAELAELTELKLQRIKDISSGRVDGLKRDEIALLVENLHLNPEWLTTGEGEIFKSGFSRSLPSKSEFVSDVIDKIVKIVEPDFYMPVADEVLNLPVGSAANWIKGGKIPYWFLKKFAAQHNLHIDELIYGKFEETKPQLSYENVEFKQSVLEQEADEYAKLTKRELALLDDFRSLSDREKDAAQTMLNAVAKHKVNKKA